MLRIFHSKLKDNLYQARDTKEMQLFQLSLNCMMTSLSACVLTRFFVRCPLSVLQLNMSWQQAGI